MARPTEEGMQKHNLIEAFKRWNKKCPNPLILVTINLMQFSANIVSIVNLQRMGEHDECGPPLNPAGFSYNAEIFMQNGCK